MTLTIKGAALIVAAVFAGCAEASQRLICNADFDALQKEVGGRLFDTDGGPIAGETGDGLPAGYTASADFYGGLNMWCAEMPAAAPERELTTRQRVLLTVMVLGIAFSALSFAFWVTTPTSWRRKRKPTTDKP